MAKAQSNKGNELPYKIIKNRYFAHNTIQKVSYFVFSSLEEFEGKVGYAGFMGEEAEKLRQEMLTAEHFEDNIVLMIVYPNVNSSSTLELKSIEEMAENKVNVNYSFDQGTDESSMRINLPLIISINKKHKDNINFIKLN